MLKLCKIFIFQNYLWHLLPSPDEYLLIFLYSILSLFDCHNYQYLKLFRHIRTAIMSTYSGQEATSDLTQYAGCKIFRKQIIFQGNFLVPKMISHFLANSSGQSCLQRCYQLHLKPTYLIKLGFFKPFLHSQDPFCRDMYFSFPLSSCISSNVTSFKHYWGFNINLSLNLTELHSLKRVSNVQAKVLQ